MSEQQIRERFEAFAAAWNAHDVAAMAECFVARGNITHPWGDFAAGRDEITALLEREHRAAMRESRCRFDHLALRQLSDTSAVVEAQGVLERVLAPNGSVYELPHRINAVVVEEDGWRFLSMNPTPDRAGR